jgi:hypothetical protein
MKKTILSVTSIDPKTFNGFQAWHIPTHERGVVSVPEILPYPAGYASGIICTSGAVYDKSKSEIVFANFDELFEGVGKPKNWKSLQQVYKQYRIEEDETSLSAELAQIFIESAQPARTAWIHCDYDPEYYAWEVSVEAYLLSEDLVTALPHVFGEYQVAPTVGLAWFMYITDDDPFIFFSARKELVQRLAKQWPELVMEIPEEMRYI